MARQLSHQRGRDAGLVGGARARGDHHGIGPHRQDLVGGGPIVAEDPHLARQFAQILDEVVRERVVVVDDNNHGVPWFARLTRSSARTNAFALFTVSTYSRSGTESATMPAPACTYARFPATTIVRMVMAVSIFPENPRYPTAPEEAEAFVAGQRRHRVPAPPVPARQ